MRSIPNGITPSSHGVAKPQVEALFLLRRLSTNARRVALTDEIGREAVSLAAHGRQGHEASAMRQPIPNPLMCQRYSRGTENEQENTTEAGGGELPPCGRHASCGIVC